MNALIETIAKTFHENEWNYERDDDPELLHFGFSGENASYRAIALANEDNRVIIFTLAAPTNVPEARRAAMAEFLARANWGLRLGNFEMDMSDGEFRYRVSACFTETEPATALIREMLGTALVTFDRYYPGIMAVCFADQNPEHAVASIEGGQNE